MQPDKKSDCAICTNDLISVSLALKYVISVEFFYIIIYYLILIKSAISILRFYKKGCEKGSLKTSLFTAKLIIIS